MDSPRRAVAVACIALVVVAGILPLGGVSLDWVVVPAPFVFLQALPSTGSLVYVAGSDETSSAFCLVPDSRGPPQA